MGFLYVKVIESKKVAVRSSFFVNYPFIRLIVGKEKRNTGFKPGVEWWDKIYNFRDISCDDDIVLYAQARDKSIHVFGSDWLGESSIRLKPLMDGKVHQLWFKLGRGRKQHSRTPRGYLHLAFQYFHEPPNGQRPFASPPVEPVLAFEDWLAVQDRSDSRIFSSSTSSVNPSTSRSSEAERLRQSAPADNRFMNSPPPARAAPLGSKPKSKSSVSFKNTPETIKNRPRASTLPTDVQSPHEVRRSALKKKTRSDDESSDVSSDASGDEREVVKTANLIDLSLFDSPKGKSTGRQYDVGDKFDRIPSPTQTSPSNISQSLSASNTSAPVTSSQDNVINNAPTYNWYLKDASQNTFNPANPFVAMHEAHAPAFTVKN